MKMIDLNESLTKDQKNFYLILKSKPWVFKQLIRDEDGFIRSNIWTCSDGTYLFNSLHDFDVNYLDDCVSISIRHISIILPWFGEDKEIENSTRFGFYRTQISIEEKKSKTSFIGNMHSIPKDVYDYLLKGGKEFYKPKPKPIEIIPDFSSILVKVDTCIN